MKYKSYQPDNILPNWLSKSLHWIQKHGGYWFGHLPIIQKTLVKLEDWFNNHGCDPCPKFRRSWARVIHYLTGNTIFYMSYEQGNDSNNGSTWALAWKTITSGATSARIASGDVIRIEKSSDPTSLGINATFTDGDDDVTLASALTANIDMCETAWTAANGASASASSSYRKEGSYDAYITLPGTPATNTKYAYKTISDTDFSGYQQVSFWIRNSSAIADGNRLKLCLCSDTSGDVIVDTIPIPAIPSTSKLLAITVDTEGALGSSIQSVALYSGSSVPNSSYYYIDNIIACKAAASADSLSLTSLISKNSLDQGGTENWYNICSINGTAVKLDRSTQDYPGQGKYSGTSETVAVYKRETIKTTPKTSSSSHVQEVQDSGIKDSLIEFQGGYEYDTTNQNGETIYDGQNGYGYGFVVSHKHYIKTNKLSFIKYYYNVYLNGPDFSDFNFSFLTSASYYSLYLTNCPHLTTITVNYIHGSYIHGAYLYSTYKCVFTFNYISGCSLSGIYFTGCYGNKITFTKIRRNQEGIQSNEDGSFNKLYGGNIEYNSGKAYYNCNCPNNYFYNITTTGNGGGVYYGWQNYFINCLINEATEFNSPDTYSNRRVYSHKHDQTIDNHLICTDGGSILSEGTTRHTASGIAWKLAITGSHRISDYPLDFVIAKIAVAASSLVTVKAWVKKDHATNVGAKLVCRGGQINGVSSDVTDTKADDTNWEELDITFTPTEAGVVEIELWAYYIAANSNVYVDDMTITQA